jgi:hypothetical protein
MQVRQAKRALEAWLAALYAAVDKLDGGNVSGRLRDPTLPAWEDSTHLLERSIRPQSGGSQSNSDAAQAEKELLACGDLLAGRIEQAWAATGEAAQQRLESAQAAATRSCAYLACANLAIEGGAVAGEGKGSLRCSGCKVAWYCSTDCSHADWKTGGHRRVCKALVAARAAQQVV